MFDLYKMYQEILSHYNLTLNGLRHTALGINPDYIEVDSSFPYYLDGVKGIKLIYGYRFCTAFYVYCDLSFYFKYHQRWESSEFIRVKFIIVSNESNLSGPFVIDILDKEIINSVYFDIDMGNFYITFSNEIYHNFISFKIIYPFIHGLETDGSYLDLLNLLDCGIKLDVFDYGLNFILNNTKNFDLSDIPSLSSQLSRCVLDFKNYTSNIHLMEKGDLFLDNNQLEMKLCINRFDYEISFNVLKELLSEIDFDVDGLDISLTIDLFYGDEVDREKFNSDLSIYGSIMKFPYLSFLNTYRPLLKDLKVNRETGWGVYTF